MKIKTEQNKGQAKTKTPYKILAFLAIALPLLSNCATIKKNDDKIISCEIKEKIVRCWEGEQDWGEEQRAPMLQEAPKLQKCSIETSGERTILTTPKGGIELDVPENIDMKKENIRAISCQPNRTIILIDNYIIRSLGYNEITNSCPLISKPCLGNISGLSTKFYFQNAVFISIAPIKETGDITDMKIVDGKVVMIVIGKDNNIKTVIVNTDNPSEPATVK